MAAQVDREPQSAAWAATAVERLLGARAAPLAIILAIQAALSLRLVWKTTAFLDEALYLSIGHLELAHYLHHAPMPDVSYYLSGSPLIYPPLAAVADDVGGLAAARLLSLILMLLVTFLLHGVSRRLMGSRAAAFFAVALFAGLGPTQYLGALATFDVLALALLALATWLGVRAAEQRPAVRYTLVCAGGLAMMLADAAKYAAALFDPVVVAVVVLAIWRLRGRSAGMTAGGAMVATAGVPLVSGYYLAGSSFRQGVLVTTLDRPSGSDSVGSVLALSAHATGVIAVLAVLGAVLCMFRLRSGPERALVWVLAGAEFLAPAEQARIHTLTSLYKHVDFGAWFACMVAGYLLGEWLPGLVPAQADRNRAGSTGAGGRAGDRGLALALSAAVALLAGISSAKTTGTEYAGWPNSRPIIAALSRLLRPADYYLIEDPSLVTYYLRSEIPFLHVDSTFGFSYPDAGAGRALVDGPAYALAIKQDYFAAVVLRFGATAALDHQIVRDMRADHDYRLAEVVPYRTSYGPGAYQIWVRAPSRTG
jgi:4-amino-4-deoxy-L-arabinose transferase-like glycosyltransferase